MNVWDIPKNYKPARSKVYDIYVCKPKNNTIVINSLEQCDLVKKLGGRTYFTVDELLKMSKTQPDKFRFIRQCVSQGLIYAVSDRTPFVLVGILGEMWCVDGAALSRKYQFVTSRGLVGITEQTLFNRLSDGCLQWTRVRTVPNNTQVFACFAGHTQGKIQTNWGSVLDINSPACKHGKGDFVIASRLPNGQINLQDRWVVNGIVFGVTYDNRGWTDCLDLCAVNKASSMSIDKLKKLV